MDIGRTGKIAFALIFFFLLFASAVIIVSYWTGFFSLFTPLILALSLFGAFFWKKFPVKAKRIPVQVLLSALLVTGLCAFPFLLIHPFY